MRHEDYVFVSFAFLLPVEAIPGLSPVDHDAGLEPVPSAWKAEMLAIKHQSWIYPPKKENRCRHQF